MRRRTVVLTVLALAATACSGDDADEDAATSTTSGSDTVVEGGGDVWALRVVVEGPDGTSELEGAVRVDDADDFVGELVGRDGSGVAIDGGTDGTAIGIDDGSGGRLWTSLPAAEPSEATPTTSEREETTGGRTYRIVTAELAPGSAEFWFDRDSDDLQRAELVFEAADDVPGSVRATIERGDGGSVPDIAGVGPPIPLAALVNRLAQPEVTSTGVNNIVFAAAAPETATQAPGRSQCRSLENLGLAAFGGGLFVAGGIFAELYTSGGALVAALGLAGLLLTLAVIAGALAYAVANCENVAARRSPCAPAAPPGGDAGTGTGDGGTGTDDDGGGGGEDEEGLGPLHLLAASRGQPMARVPGQEGGGGGGKGCGGGLLGDPHLSTLDGVRYDFQGTGEFVLADTGPLEVQGRFEGDAGRASWTTSFAIRAGDHVLEVRNPDPPGDATRTLLDGEPVELDVQGRSFDDGTWFGIDPLDPSLVVAVAPSGDYALIDPAAAAIEVSIFEAASAGLLGTPDGDTTNEFTTRSGDVVSREDAGTVEGLHTRFAASWRVEEDERLFSDGAWADYRTDSHLQPPAQLASLADFEPDASDGAIARCLEAGVPPVALEWCAYDLLATGDERWVEATATSTIVRNADLRAGTVAEAPALVVAVRAGDLESVQRLLGEGADVDSADDDGVTALSWAASAGDLPIVAALLAAGADPDRADDRGATSLAGPAEFGHDDVIAALLAGGADPTVQDDEGRTPLAVAALRGRSGAVLLLLDAGAPVDAADDDGRAALFWATFGRQPEVVRLLLEAGADPNQSRSDGMTALHEAAASGRDDLVDLLLDAGGDRDATDDAGNTPADLARLRGFESLAARLE